MRKKSFFSSKLILPINNDQNDKFLPSPEEKEKTETKKGLIKYD